jgi:ATP-binding cassette, subfamily B, bacterial
VARFYDPQHGTVRLDGADVRDLALVSLSRNIGVVFQDTFLFHASVRDNLLYARPDASPEKMEAAARAAHIHHDGRLVDRGTHQELLERGEPYRTLYEHQFNLQTRTALAAAG